MSKTTQQLRDSSDASDRNLTAAYVPDRAAGSSCRVCVGLAARGCYSGRHPYAYMVHHNETSAYYARRANERAAITPQPCVCVIDEWGNTRAFCVNH